MTTKGKVLVVDDEEAVRFFLVDALLRAGWLVQEAESGEEALTRMSQDPHDVMVLDLRMAGIDGVTVMQSVKEKWPQTMIIVLTAYASVESAIAAVRNGAFDYLRKPCDTQAVLNCVCRAWEVQQEGVRYHQQRVGTETAVSPPNGMIKTGDLIIDLYAHAVYQGDASIHLTPTEYEVLAYLAQTPGYPVPVSHLIANTLGYDPADPQAQETLRVHISRMRSKVDPAYIVTVRGGAYMLADLPSPS